MSAWADEPGRDVPIDWDPRSRLEPRWGPDRPLAERITRRGRWVGVDPRQRGGVWSRWKWAALVTYVGLLGGAYATAWFRHGGGRAFGSEGPRTTP